MRPSRTITATATWISLFTAMADGSGAVFSIDGHIVVGEVAGPHGFVDIAPLQVNGDSNFFLVHHCLAAGYAIIIRPAADAYQADIAQIDFQRFQVEIWYTRPAHGRQDPAPVQI